MDRSVSPRWAPKPPAALGRLGHFARTQAPGAHPDAFARAVDERLHRLKVWLETPGPDVMGMGDRPADDWSLPADRTPLGHGFLLIIRIVAPNWTGRKRQIVVDGQGMINERGAAGGWVPPLL